MPPDRYIISNITLLSGDGFSKTGANHLRPPPLFHPHSSMNVVFRKLADLPKKRLAIASVLAVASAALPLRSTRAADPYDKSLEARVEALERELNVMENDSKGKNVQSDSTEVPTFLRAAGKQVQELTIAGDLRFRYNYDNEDFQYPRRRQPTPAQPVHFSPALKPQLHL